MTDPAEVFQFAIGEDCCPEDCPGSCVTCYGGGAAEVQLDATGILLTNEDCEDCDLYTPEDILILPMDAGGWYGPHNCSYWDSYDEDPPICLADGPYHKWSVGFAYNTIYCRCDLRVFLQFPRLAPPPWHSTMEYYLWQRSYFSGWPIDISDWVELPFAFRGFDPAVPTDWACAEPVTGSVFVKEA